MIKKKFMILLHNWLLAFSPILSWRSDLIIATLEPKVLLEGIARFTILVWWMAYDISGKGV